MQGRKDLAKPPTPSDARFPARNIIVNMYQSKCDAPGMFSIDPALDDRPQTSILLFVRLNPIQS
jgi:hypothetical protein